MKSKIKISYFLILFLGVCFFSCNDDFLEKYSKSSLSEGTFWNNEDEALKALAGVYRLNGSSDEGYMWTLRNIFFKEKLSDNAFGANNDDTYQNINRGEGEAHWSDSYRRIARCNYFLENIEQVDMNESEKAEMIAEVSFIRACVYFYMSQHYGEVPLIVNTLSAEEANNVSRNTKEELVNFVIDELTEAANNLPNQRPLSEKGRVPKAAALAFKGRILMAENRWIEAASVYKNIIDMGIYKIDPRYQEIFLDDGEDSEEIIFATQYMEDGPGSLSSGVFTMFGPRMLTGAQGQMNPTNSLVEAYEMTDGKTIDESPLYDPDNPYENRDPRLYFSILLPNYSTVKGELFVTHPDSLNAPDKVPLLNLTGYGQLKFIDLDYGGTFNDYGGDIPIIRYAEILLSYLESKLEAGDPITQDLLDQTINMIRGRESVNMPLITETDPDKLRTILRRERRVELAFEGIRYWDLIRWRIAHTELNRNVYGAKVCDGQSNCNYQVDENGHYYVYKRVFREEYDYIWPIPQSELDINSNLEQTPGYN